MREVETLKPIVPEDLFEIASISDGRLSPSGRYAAYTVRKTDKSKDIDRIKVMFHDTETRTTRQISPEDFNCSSLAWSPDEKQVFYTSSREDGPQIYSVEIESNLERKITEIKRGVIGGAKISPDGRYIAFASPRDVPPLDTTKPYRLTRALYRDNALGYIGENTLDVYVLDLGTNQLKQLTDDRFDNAPISWTPDSKRILISRSGDPDNLLVRPSIEIIDLDGNRKVVLSESEWKYIIATRWLNDGKRLCFIAYPSDYPLGSQRRLWLLDTETGKYECRTTGSDFDYGWGIQTDIPIAIMGRLGISEDEKYVYTQVGKGIAIEIYRVKLEGEIECIPVVSGECSNMVADMARDKLLYTYSDINIPSEIGIYYTHTGEKYLISNVNGEFAALHPKLELEPIVYQSTDGVEVKSFLLLPPKGLSKAPYATVTYYHGGPMAGMGYIYYFECQMLANAGYAVFYSNFRGSSGFGDSFARGVYEENSGVQELADTLAGLDLCIKLGLVNGEKMGCCGISYGGFMTCWSVGHSNRFKAAVSENPVTNKLSLMNMSDYIWYSLDEFNGKQIHEAYEPMLKASPVFYAHNCKTPILMVQSEQDFRCNSDQTEQFYTIVRLNGGYAEMLRMPNSNHGSSNNGNNIVRRAQNEAMLEWFQRYIPVENGSNTERGLGHA